MSSLETALRYSLPSLVLLLLMPAIAIAQEADTDWMIESAMSAGPESVSADARIIDWSMNELRAGTNGWTCLPDNPDGEGDAPWCVDEAWMIAAIYVESGPVCQLRITSFARTCGFSRVSLVGKAMPSNSP